MHSPACSFEALDLMEPGDRLELNFRREAVDVLGYLVDICRKGQIEMAPYDQNRLVEILLSGNWGNDANRIFSVLVINTFDRGAFEAHLAHALEFVSVQPRRPFVDRNALMAVQSGQRLRLRFKADGFTGLGELIELVRAGFVDCHTPSRVALEGVFVLEEWPNPVHREVEVVINPSFVRERELVESIFMNVFPHLELMRIRRIAVPRITVTTSV